MVLVHVCYWWRKFYQHGAPCRYIWLLFILLIIVQIIWQSQKYKYITFNLTHQYVSKATNTARGIFASLSASLHSNSQSFNTFDSIAEFPDGRFQDIDNILYKDETMFMWWLHKSLSARSNSTSLQMRQLQHLSRNNIGNGCRTLLDIERTMLYTTILKHFTLTNNDTRDNFVNLHRYDYILDSHVCRERPHVLILVHSKFDHFKRRREIRQTWAFNRTINDMSFRTVFLLGQPNQEQVKPTNNKKNGAGKRESSSLAGKETKTDVTMSRIRLESVKFGDIVMGNFTDSYRNLTIKHIMALHWVASRCPHSWYIAKVDDDILVNTYNIARFIRQTNIKPAGSSDTELLACRIPQLERVQRNMRDKWYVHRSEYPFQIYPTWCLGYGILMTRNVAEKLLKASRNVRSFWIDDVYVTGLLRFQAGISLTSLPTNMNKSTPTSSKYDTIFMLRSYIKNYTFLTYWQNLVSANYDVQDPYKN